MEYVVGPVLALLLGMKFTAFKTAQQNKAVKALEERVELVVTQQTEIENTMPKKMMATIVPVAQAVKRLNQQVGIK